MLFPINTNFSEALNTTMSEVIESVSSGVLSRSISQALGSPISEALNRETGQGLISCYACGFRFWRRRTDWTSTFYRKQRRSFSVPHPASDAGSRSTRHTLRGQHPKGMLSVSPGWDAHRDL